ncbi:DinB family protein [Robertkochia solimangrovi]|uniref:DinB family protein n=1 Tax=Robertkochia solimangrovi TaxID=2213046 RepID=UPI00117E6595|nr:DinB family protein [Robertkochia solimangrovi]TRZ45978.1 DinB family protein [Robertkochia solimangrovi]
MKYLIILFAFLYAGTANVSAQDMTKDERKKAINMLENSRDQLLEDIRGLSDEQLNFKPDETSWSIAECVEHITTTEDQFMTMLEKGLEEPANPERRSEVKFDDNSVYKMITDRSTKFKTSEPLEPTEKYGDFKSTLKAYKSTRNNTLKYVRSSKDDLRNHYMAFPFGTVDMYQLLIFDAGHNMRHNEQIAEIMANPSFPKK